MRVLRLFIKDFKQKRLSSASMFGQKPERIEPKEGQESVWDYPRPPRMEDVSKRIRIVVNGDTIADSTKAKRILETSHPPTYYIPQEDIKMDYLVSTSKHTFCEFKGEASYYDLKVGDKLVKDVAWYYKTPTKQYAAAANHLCFYASKVDECYVGEEKVQAQSGDFYGGWITNDVVGPFKGASGTWGW